MVWIILSLLALLAAWIGVGVLLLARDSRRQGLDYQREVEGRVYPVGDTIEVALRLTAPAKMRLADDHDIVLAIDHSSSMGGGPGSPLREALRAAENFIQRLPDNMHVGIVSFDHEAQVLCSLTGEHRRALRGVATINSGGGTAIHSALERSHETLREGRANVRKTVILLSDGGSDQNAAVAAAAPFHTSSPQITLISIGFGSQVDEELMRAISTGGDKYLHVDKPEDLYSLFGYLAAAVSGQMAVAGLVDEGTRSPDPFRLANTGGLYPVGVQPENPTRIIWSVPLMDDAPIPLTYNLVPQCPGWHAVATSDSHATWRMPDGTESKTPGPPGPRVLVMPRWLGWAWPILNPLFWMLFGRFWPCAVAQHESARAPEIEPLPVAAFPALLPAPQDRLYEPQVKPALVIGLGEVGEWTVCRLKERLRDREIDPAHVEVLALHVTHRVNRKPVKVRKVAVEVDELVELHQDLRPYLETLRRDGSPPMRSWIPWREWLAEMLPLTTSRTIADDRRKARLSLLRKPEPVEAKLAPSLHRLTEQDDGIVVLVGSADDAECSGLLAEVAHICAERGAGVTCVFAPSGFERSASASVPALARELERMTLMSGKSITSDRHEPLVSARKLFDRIIVLEQQHETPEQSSIPTAELIWDMLAFEEVFKSLPSVRNDNDRVICCGVLVDGQALPVASLWHWVRERTLAAGINGHRLGLTEKNGKLLLPAPDRQATQSDVEAFWTGQNCQRPQNLLLRSSRTVLQSGNSDPVSALLSLQDEIPVDSPYHEQVTYSQREQQVFIRYTEEWCQFILEREQDNGGWGIHKLIAAVLRVEEDFKLIVNSINRLSGNEDFAILVSFAAAMYADFLAMISNLRRELADWLAALVGTQLEWNIDSTPQGKLPACYDIEEGRHESEESLYIPDRLAQEFLDRRFDEWFRLYGDPLLSQLRFRAVVEPGTQRLDIKLRHLDQELEPKDDLTGTFRSALDQYRNVVLGWPLDQWVKSEEIARPFDRFRIGKNSGLIYPSVTRALDENDPFTVAAIQVQERTLESALGVESMPHVALHYTWPEEANAARIAQKIRNRLQHNPQPFTPVAVHLMRDTRKLEGFINDLAQGRVVPRGTRFILKRDGRDYEVGPANENLRSLEAFQDILQQVVSLEVSIDGEPIPPPLSNSTQSYEETMRAVEAHPLGKAATGFPDWQMWKDVIRGLWLEHGERTL